MIAEKHYQDDWAKAKSRDLVGKMLDETILTFRKPKDVKVLHFGGIDLAEARQVYLPRGIYPKNIVSIERNKSIAEAQKMLGLGIKVVPKTLDEYLKDPKTVIDFDVVSLDYTGPITHDQNKITGEIVSKQKRNTFLFHSANLLRRDNKSNELYYIAHTSDSFTPLNREEEELAASLDYVPGSLAGTVAKHLILSEKMKTGESLKDIKAEAYHDIVALGYQQRINDVVDMQRLFDFTSGKNLARKRREFEVAARQLFDVPEEKVDGSKVANFACRTVVTMQFASNFIKNNILERLREAGVNAYRDDMETQAGALHCMLPQLIAGTRPFHTVTHRGYSYISESGSPMAGDISLLTRPYRVYEALEEVARKINFPHHFEIKDTLAFTNAMDKLIFAYESDIFAKRKKERKSDVAFLGNSSRPILTKRRFVQELEEGKEIPEIQSKYRGWANLPLAQWKAHHTMGTYREEMSDEPAEDSNLEKITKEQAIDLLSSNIPAQEIHEAYPTSFTPAQLRAFKAHMTMGTYETNAAQNHKEALSTK